MEEQKSYYEVTVRYSKMTESGMVVDTSEKYIAKTYTCADAEKCIVEELAPFDTNNSLKIMGVKKMNITEVLSDDLSEGKWYKVKAMAITIDEKTFVEKKKPYFYLVGAEDFDSAVSVFKKNVMTGSVSDWTIHTVKETAIVDVYEC